MSLSHQGGRRSWRILSQLRHSSSSWSLSPSPSAHLGLQTSRLHGLFSSSFYLHHVYVPPSFSSAAEAAHVVNSAEPEAFPSVDSTTEVQAAPSAMAPNLEEDQEGSIFGKMLEEHREILSTLRSAIEEQKSLTQSIFDGIRVLQSNKDEKIAERNIAAKRQIQSEWTAFMEYLQSCDFFQDENGVNSVGSASTFDDPARVKRAIFKFSQAHNSVFESLSLIDLRIIARHGRTDNDPKAAASQKRLRQFFNMEDASSDAAVAAKPAVTQPKLSDVTRLLYSIILEGSFGDEVRSAISHMLREVVSSSRKSSVMPSLAAEATPSSKPRASLSTSASDRTEELRQEKGKRVKLEQEGNTHKVGTVKVEEASKLTTRVEATNPKTAAAPAPHWKCPRCSFMNLDTKHRCVECSGRRPQQTYQSETEKINGDHVSEVKVPLDKRPGKKALERKDSSTSLSAQVRDSTRDRSSSSAIQDEDSMDLEDSGTEGEVSSDGSEASSVLDDILESEESDDEGKEGKQFALSDVSEDDEQGKGKRATLSKLFPKLEYPASRRDNQRGSAVRRNRGRFPNGRRFDDDDGIGRSKFGSLGVDEEEGSEGDNAPPHRSRRGFGSRDDDFTRRRGNRGGRDSFKGRGGRDYGGAGGGGRGDFLEGRQDGGGFRGGSAYGGRDGGGRSSSFGSRSPRGRAAF